MNAELRTLTDDEVTEEVGHIERFQAWPLFPVLPVKHIHRGEPDHPVDERCGIVLATLDAVVPEVILMNLWELQGGQIGPQIESRRRITFDSVEAMVRAGWIGD